MRMRLVRLAIDKNNVARQQLAKDSDVDDSIVHGRIHTSVRSAVVVQRTASSATAM